jgi:hypothetical protein
MTKFNASPRNYISRYLLIGNLLEMETAADKLEGVIPASRSFQWLLSERTQNCQVSATECLEIVIPPLDQRRYFYPADNAAGWLLASDAMWDLATLEAPTNFWPCTALGSLNAATLCGKSKIVKKKKKICPVLN